jgi:hypothetical protein
VYRPGVSPLELITQNRYESRWIFSNISRDVRKKFKKTKVDSNSRISVLF